MLSNNKIKLLRALQHKKYRYIEQLFVVEGDKMVRELLSSNFDIQEIYATEEWATAARRLLDNHQCPLFIAPLEKLKLISSFTTPNQVLAVVKMPSPPSLPTLSQLSCPCFALDGLQDPGNMGTILRTADWLGMPYLFCTNDTVDIYNPKTVQATMGAIFRVPAIYTDLVQTLDNYSQLPVYGAVLTGKPLFDVNCSKAGFLLIGNEGAGIRPHLLPRITCPITIPARGNAESLNAAIAAGIIGAWAVLGTK